MTLSNGNEVVSLNFGTLAPGGDQLAMVAPLIADDNGGVLGSGTPPPALPSKPSPRSSARQGAGTGIPAVTGALDRCPARPILVLIGTSASTINFSGNNGDVANLEVAQGGELNVTGAQLTVSDELVADGQVISGGGALSVTGSVSIGALGGIQVNNRSTSLENVAIAAGGSIQVSNNNYLFAGGTYANAGLIGVSSLGNDTRIVIPAAMTLTSTGTVQMSNSSQNTIASNGGPAILTNVGNTMNAGQIGDGNLTLNNEAGGTIDATDSNQLIIQGGQDANAGLLEGTGPAALLLRSAAIANTGTIAAPLAGSSVDLQSAAITGGTLQDANGDIIQDIDRGSSLDDVTLTTGSEFNVPNNNYLTLAGSLTNEGTVSVASGGTTRGCYPSGSVTLTGTGVVALSNNSQNFLYTNGSPATLINAGNTIEGAGQIGDGNLSLNNEAGGTIDATDTTQLIIFGNTDMNAGLLEDTARRICC